MAGVFILFASTGKINQCIILLYLIFIFIVTKCNFIFSNKLLFLQIMSKPKILLHHFKIIFQVGCFLTAIYFTTLFSTQYLENTDTQLIAMKTFNEEPNNDQFFLVFFCSVKIRIICSRIQVLIY